METSVSPNKREQAKPGHVIHIGFPKCASKFLQTWFAAHPQIAYQTGSFGGVRDVYGFIAGVLTAPESDQCRVTSNEELSDPRDPASFSEVETTPVDRRRYHMVRVCQELARLFPDASILMITRNQADMVLSGYSQLIKQGGHIRDVDFARFEAEGFKDLHPFDFELALKTYRQHFGGRVLALPYELLVDDRAAFLAEVADFLGVERYDIAAGRINQSLDDDQLYWYPRISRLLRFAPTQVLRRKLIAVHCRMIRIGAWRPLLNLLKWILGPKALSRALSPDMLQRLTTDCEELLKSKHFVAYRQLYRGTIDSAVP